MQTQQNDKRKLLCEVVSCLVSEAFDPPKTKTEEKKTHQSSVFVSVSELSVPSHRLTQERKRDEVTEDGADDDAQEDPGVVGHDAEHQHVAQSDLHDVEERLDDVQQPALPGACRWRLRLYGGQGGFGRAAVQR